MLRSCLTRLFFRCTCTQNAHLRLVNSAFSYFVRLKLTLIIQLLRIRSYITRLFFRSTCTQNAHLRLVNCGFSSFASLKSALVIQLLRVTLAKLLVSQCRENARCELYFRVATILCDMTYIVSPIGR